MGKRKIQSYDREQLLLDWPFIKEKKELLKVMCQKGINSEFYLVFTDVTALYVFLYLSLAPEEAFGFQKVQPILSKMKGENNEFASVFDECRRKLSIDWNGEKPLSQEISKIKTRITEQQVNIYDLSSRIEEQEAKQLLKSGLSQRKIHLDYHTSDGQNEEAIIPTIANVNDYLAIIFDEKMNRYLLSFLAHVPESDDKLKMNEGEKSKMFQAEKPRMTERQKPRMAEREKPRMAEGHKNTQAQTMKNRPIIDNVPNPDDRLLPRPAKSVATKPAKERKWSEDRVPVSFTIPSFESDYYINRSQIYWRNPEQHSHRHERKPLYESLHSSRPMPTVPRKIKDPDQKLLPPPPRGSLAMKSLNRSLHSNNKKGYRDTLQTRKNQPHQHDSNMIQQLKQNVVENVVQLKEKAVELGKKAQAKIQQAFEQIKENKMNWLNLAITGSIILAGVNILRA